MITPWLMVPESCRASPEYVYKAILLHFGSWANAWGDPDGRAVIESYLPADWQPPEDELETESGWWTGSIEPS